MKEQPLHPLERRLLRALLRGGEMGLEEIARRAKMKVDQVRRAVEWLREKDLLSVREEATTLLSLGAEGMKALRQGLPERRLLRLLSSRGGEMPLIEARGSFKDEDEFNAALGLARRRGWISLQARQGSTVLLLREEPEELPEESLLKALRKGSIERQEVERRIGEEVVRTLERRPGYLSEEKVKSTKLKLSDKGRSLAEALKVTKEVDAITPRLLLKGLWRRHSLRPIDVEAPAPPLYAGKKHPVQRFLDEVREIFVALGFQEIEGPLVQPSFWNFDALFIPQDHPAREMQDTFYIKDLKASKIDDRFLERVRRVHEDGGSTGSRGWGYSWSLDEARRLVLRTHTTCVTIKYLADNEVEEARVFSVGRVFRNEKVTYKNLVEFHQIEGIAVGPRANLREMMGLLSAFYSRLGLKRVKFWPSFFPYTEPSLQSVVYFEPLKKWIELCGMGIFRPEVTLPLGVKNPVLAWGGGLERLVMLRYGLEDIRQLYENDLGWLRRASLCRW